MYRVLLAADANEDRTRTIAEAVAAIPGTDDVAVTVLNVYEAFEVADEGAQIDSKDLFDESDYPESVTVATDILEAEGISTTTRREHGEPAETIVRVAEEIDASVIAMAGRKRSPAGKVLFGSVTQSVLLSASQPVQVVLQD